MATPRSNLLRHNQTAFNDDFELEVMGQQVDLSWALNDPIRFCREILGDDLTEQQGQTLEALRDNKQVAFTACHAVGKSFLATRAALVFLAAHSKSKVLTTAAGWRGVETIFWSEIGAVVTKVAAVIPGLHRTKTALWASDNRFIMGFSADKPEAAQGHHSPNILLIIDEATAITYDLMAAIDSMLSTPGSKALYLSNPLRRTSAYYDITQSPSVKHIQVSCFDSPNFVANKIKTVQDIARLDPAKVKITHSYLTDPVWAQEKLNDWGERHHQFIARVLGRFPDANDDALIQPDWLDEAFGRQGFEESECDQIVYGFDVAMGGSDKSALFKIGWRGDEVTAYDCSTWSKSNTDTNVAEAEAVVDEDCPINIDANGVGKGVADNLRAAGYDARDYNGGAKPDPSNAETHANARAESYDKLRWLLETGQLHLGRVKHLRPELITGLTWLTTSINKGGKMLIVDKEVAKKNAGAGKSGFDEADALAMAVSSVSGGNVYVI